MSQFLLQLSSKSADIKPNGDGSDFTIVFKPGISLPAGEWDVALLKASTWFSWNNISSELKNNKLEVAIDANFPGIADQFEFDDGNYDIDAINKKIYDVYQALGKLIPPPPGSQSAPPINGGKVGVSPIQFVANGATGKVDIQFAAYKYTGNPSVHCQPRINFNQLDTIGTLLGWVGTVTGLTAPTDGKTFYEVIPGQNDANITLGINSILVEVTGLTEGTYVNGFKIPGVLAQIQPMVAPGHNIQYEPNLPVFLPVAYPDKAIVNSLRVRILDQDRNPLPGGLNGQETTLSLLFRPRVKAVTPPLDQFVATLNQAKQSSRLFNAPPVHSSPVITNAPQPHVSVDDDSGDVGPPDAKRTRVTSGEGGLMRGKRPRWKL